MYRFQSTVITTLLCVFLLILSGSVLAAEDNIDYDHAADFSKIKTFEMADTSKGALAKANQLLAQRVHDQVVQHLTTQKDKLTNLANMVVREMFSHSDTG